MGILERIEFKLNAIGASLGLAFGESAEVSQDAVNAMQTFTAVASAAVEKQVFEPVVAETNAAPATTQLPVARLTVKQAIADKLKLTGNEIDENGCYWSEKVNTKVPAVTAKNVWKRGKGIDDSVYEAEIARIKAEVAGETAGKTEPAAEVTAPATLPQPGSSLPQPGAGATLPQPGNTAANQPAPLDDKQRREIINITNVLCERYKVDFEGIRAMFNDYGSAGGSFIDVPKSSYDAIQRIQNNWCLILDAIDAADVAILSMNNNDQSYLVKIMSALKLGTTEIETVYYRDLPKLHQEVHSYLNLLEQHFGKPVTPFTAIAME